MAMQQQLAAQNPNHNEVMNFDPVDGREIRGRGRSRDASNSRLIGPQNLGGISSMGSNYPGNYNSNFPNQGNISDMNMRSMDINDQI